MTILRWLVVVAMVCGASPAFGGADRDSAQTFPTYTLNSVNYAPNTTGEDITAYDGRCTVGLVVSSGQIRVNVETSILQQDGTALGFVNAGTLSASTNQTLTGPIDRVRLNVTCCETDCSDGAGGAGTCLAKAAIRCRLGS